MKKLLLTAMLLTMAMDVSAGFGRGGSSGGRSFSSGRSYSSYSRPSYSRPSYGSYRSSPGSYSNHTVVHHTNGSGLGSGGGIGSHLGAGALGYMLGSNNHPTSAPVYVNGVAQPVQQPVAPQYADTPQQYVEPIASDSHPFKTIFWTIMLCFGVTVLIYLVIKRGEHCDH